MKRFVFFLLSLAIGLGLLNDCRKKEPPDKDVVYKNYYYISEFVDPEKLEFYFIPADGEVADVRLEGKYIFYKDSLFLQIVRQYETRKGLTVNTRSMWNHPALYDTVTKVEVIAENRYNANYDAGASLSAITEVEYYSYAPFINNGYRIPLDMWWSDERGAVAYRSIASFFKPLPLAALGQLGSRGELGWVVGDVMRIYINELHTNPEAVVIVRISFSNGLVLEAKAKVGEKFTWA